jgi:hypothetical protein
VGGLGVDISAHKAERSKVLDPDILYIAGVLPWIVEVVEEHSRDMNNKFFRTD